MRCKDSVGNSDMKGILMHRSNYFGIYFFKNYDNPSSAGQTGSFEWLAYDGVQQG